jgi:hypothetical protein
MANGLFAKNMIRCGKRLEARPRQLPDGSGVLLKMSGAPDERGAGASNGNITDGIMRSPFWGCRAALAAVTCLLALILAFPGSAQAGFLEDLFGSLFQPPPAYRGYRDSPAWGAGGFRHRAHPWRHKSGNRSAARKKIIAAAKPDTAGPQQPVDIMADKSLRKGDVVMTQSGIRIFVGQSGDRHEPDDFRKPSEVKGLSKSARKALAVLEPGDAAPPVPASIVTGRSATGRAITAGEVITDAKGKTIRYVGP